MKSKETRVLVAEDHQGIREFLVNFLNEEFEMVGVVSNGYKLIEAVIHLQPDVVVSDFRLPGLTGTAAMMRLRDMGVDVPFVFLSADRDLVTYIATECGTCICKTDVVSELIPAIRSVLDEKSEASTANRARLHALTL